MVPNFRVAVSCMACRLLNLEDAEVSAWRPSSPCPHAGCSGGTDSLGLPGDSVDQIFPFSSWAGLGSSLPQTAVPSRGARQAGLPWASPNSHLLLWVLLRIL